MRRLRILTFIAVILSFIVYKMKNREAETVPAGEGLLPDRSWMIANKSPQTPVKDIRPPDQTFLTYPEWFLVFSPSEQADYFKTHTSTSFPYMKHHHQLWESYAVIYDQIKDNYKFNTGYHVMIMVLGISTTVEYSVKSFYETIAGRITDTPSGNQMTAEDQFNAAYLKSYVNFIEDTPWYMYDFKGQLKNLWTTTSWSGPHFLRKLERRYYLSTELMIKGGYGWLIGLATKSAYDEALLNTAVVLNKLPDAPSEIPELKNIKQLSDSAVLVDLPRYADFKDAVSKLAKYNVSFQEIAGNRGAIMLTVIRAKPLQSDANLKVLFSQPIVTKPGLKRIALVTTVPNLINSVQKLLNDKVTIEHIYDF